MIFFNQQCFQTINLLLFVEPLMVEDFWGYSVDGLDERVLAVPDVHLGDAVRQHHLGSHIRTFCDFFAVHSRGFSALTYFLVMNCAFLSLISIYYTSLTHINNISLGRQMVVEKCIFFSLWSHIFSYPKIQKPNYRPI